MRPRSCARHRANQRACRWSSPIQDRTRAPSPRLFQVDVTRGSQSPVAGEQCVGRLPTRSPVDEDSDTSEVGTERLMVPPKTSAMITYALTVALLAGWLIVALTRQPHSA